MSDQISSLAWELIFLRFLFLSFVEFAACSSHQAATNIVKYLIQGHNNMSRVGVEP